jgi:hypothetical protein
LLGASGAAAGTAAPLDHEAWEKAAIQALDAACNKGQVECVEVILSSSVTSESSMCRHTLPGFVGIAGVAGHEQVVRALLNFLGIPLPLPPSYRPATAAASEESGSTVQPGTSRNASTAGQQHALVVLTSEGFARRCAERDHLAMLQFLVHDLHVDPHDGNNALLCQAAAAGAMKVVQWLLSLSVPESSSPPHSLPTTSPPPPPAQIQTSLLPNQQQTTRPSSVTLKSVHVAGGQQQEQQRHLASRALLHAVRGGQEAVVRLALEAGADPDVEQGECLVDTVYSEAVGVLLMGALYCM